MLTLPWLLIGLFALGVVVTTVANGLRALNRRPHARRDDRDQHAEWLGIGTAVSFHEERI